MNRTKTFLALAFCFGLSLVASAAFAQDDSPSIVGTYQFVSSLLPDSTVIESPVIVGLITFTETHRNFNASWTDKDGRRVSLSSISEYKLTSNEYTEKNIYYMKYTEGAEEPITFDFSDQSATSKVTKDQGGIRFKMPLHDEPEVFFKGDELVAIEPGVYEDHWKKIK
ncbi:MAG: hypothetical protein IIB00_07515 [candidate division Zixibacteria bacterium]|nr:hypothetical protein [candidate division Zixibacteria bacterium]